MTLTLERILKLMNEKYPPKEWDFASLLVNPDGSGFIYYGTNPYGSPAEFAFSNLLELELHLTGEQDERNT